MNPIWDPREHRRLRANRRLLTKRRWQRIQRAIAIDDRWWTPADRALVCTDIDDDDPVLVAIGEELLELHNLQRDYERFLHGSRSALERLVDVIARGEQLLLLMPKGRLPRNPRANLLRVLKQMKREVIGRMVLHWWIGARRPPAGSNRVTFAMGRSPTWGHTDRILVIERGATLIELQHRVPSTLRFRWNVRGYRLLGRGFEVTGEWGREPICKRGARAERTPTAKGWPVLPKIVEAKRSLRIGRARHHVQTRIELAWAVLESAWPEGAQTVGAFTRAIVPVDQEEVVSYSFASCPGWSFINLYNRDFIDLIDDLVHENAHHHLNLLLVDRPLLLPGRDENLIYYSPWRETLRPLRGILHSVFTFAAGAQLFGHLWLALERNQPMPYRFRASERKKIASRCLEELMQVRYSLTDLAHAAKMGHLTQAGRRFIAPLSDDNRRALRNVGHLRKAIRNSHHEQRLAHLEGHLRIERARYRY